MDTHTRHTPHMYAHVCVCVETVTCMHACTHIVYKYLSTCAPTQAHTCVYMCTCMHSANMYTAHTQVLTEPRSPQHLVQDEHSRVHYILLSAPWAVLCYYAEDLRLKLPLQVPGVHDIQRRPGGPPKPGLLMTAPHVLGAVSIADNLRLPIFSSKVPRSCHHTPGSLIRQIGWGGSDPTTMDALRGRRVCSNHGLV